MYQWFMPEVGDAQQGIISIDDLAADTSDYGKPTKRRGGYLRQAYSPQLGAGFSVLALWTRGHAYQSK